MSTIIAERELGYTNFGSTVSGRVVIEAPEPDEADWRCFYSVSLPGMDFRRRTMGVDSFQALQLAMVSAVSEIANSDAFKTGRLTVFGEPLLTVDDLKQCFGLPRLHGDA